MYFVGKASTPRNVITQKPINIGAGNRIHSKGGKPLHNKKYVSDKILCLPSRSWKQSVAGTCKRQSTIDTGTMMSSIPATVNAFTRNYVEVEVFLFSFE